MTRPISDIAFTPAVKAIQKRLGSRRIYEKVEQRGGWSEIVSEDLAAFITLCDSSNS